MSSEIDKFLDSYSAEVAGVSRKLRAFVRAAAPDSTETLHAGWKVISYGHRKKFCAIAPHAKWVNLQFHAGASLLDPTSRLSGSGKSMRHAKVVAACDADASLRDLIEQASTLAQ